MGLELEDGEDRGKQLVRGITLFELIIVVAALLYLSGLVYVIYEVNELKTKSFLSQQFQIQEKWKSDVTGFLNYNHQIGKLVSPPATPQMQPAPQQGGKK